MSSKSKKKCIVTRKSNRPKLRAHVRQTPLDPFADDTLDAQGPKKRDTAPRTKTPARRSPYKSTLDYAEALEFDPAFTHSD